MKIGFFPGSFDPFSNGHLDMIRKTSKEFDKIIVAIMTNPIKKIKRRRRFPKDIMKKQMEKVFEREKLDNVEVIMSSNFFLSVALKYKASVIIRGIRKNNPKDCRNEPILAFIYKITLGLDTLFIYDDNNFSSTLIMEMLKNGKNVEHLVPPEIFEVIKEKTNQ